MQHGDITQGAFTLLYNDHVRFSEYERIDGRSVRLSLPFKSELLTHEVSYSVREKRPLVVLDGEVPECGLAKQSSQAAAVPLGDIRAPESHRRIRKPHEIPLGAPSVLMRRFLIIPQGKGVCIRYRTGSSANKFVVINIHHVHENTWKLVAETTTY